MSRPAFRGQADTCWPLLSGAVRRLRDAYGDEVLEDQINLGRLVSDYHREQLLLPMQVIDGDEKSDLQRLSVLQHHGAATGLLDFTENALVALWFACSEEPGKDGSVFMVDIGDHQFATNGRGLVDPFDAGREVVYYEPDRSLGARIVAQQSLFVICNPQIPDRHVHSVTVPQAAKEATLAHLRRLGLSETGLFGDVPGLAAANTSLTPLQREDKVAPERHRDRGNRAYQSRRYVDALAAYERYASALPDVAQPHCLRGDALAALGRYDEAISAYTRAIDKISRPIDLGQGVSVNWEVVGRRMLHALHYNRGNAHAAVGNHAAAIADYDCALEHGDEQKRNVLFNCGNSKYALERFDEAHWNFKEAWAEGLGGDAASAMGNCKVLMGEFDEALRRYLDGTGVVGAPQNVAETCRKNAGQMRRLLETLEGHEYDVSREKHVVYVDAACAAEPFPIIGHPGNTGNIPSGMTTAHGGQGYEGVVGFVVVIRPPPLSRGSQVIETESSLAERRSCSK